MTQGPEYQGLLGRVESDAVEMRENLNCISLYYVVSAMTFPLGTLHGFLRRGFSPCVKRMRI